MQAPAFTSTVSNSTFQYATNLSDFASGTRICNNLGGHLATYTSLEEQQEVEQHFISAGYLFPKFRTFYWIGLRINATQEPRKFTYTDPTLTIDPFDASASYAHWGVAAGQQEPNNLYFPPELCTGANFTQAYSDAAGWADANCGTKYPVMCKLAREWPPPLLMLMFDDPRCGAVAGDGACAAPAQAQLTCRALRLAPTARGAQIPFINPTNNNTYILNSTLADFDLAEAYCLASGGHLASFSSAAEQYDVEQFYIKKGLLFPTYHKSYWFGLYTNANGWKTSWKFTDNTPFNYFNSYTNWGVSSPEGLTSPNNMTGSEFCMAANASEVQNSRWGWEDYNCLVQMPFICEIPRGWRLAGGAAKLYTLQASLKHMPHTVLTYLTPCECNPTCLGTHFHSHQRDCPSCLQPASLLTTRPTPSSTPTCSTTAQMASAMRRLTARCRAATWSATSRWRSSRR